ncbi:MAG: type-F conjugative transfer system pilin assembly thiol-disulfide isomerase TrbB [Sodalis sp. (in: enterobacteria)]|uniref:type-F conjugative transfer system pilin assembly thiol-disulfide isomerase TrbB n=1 Tax=Sodalis sp. (in: enterobacteria) TaxID=1898979 RepID=UPI0039E38D62
MRKGRYAVLILFLGLLTGFSAAASVRDDIEALYRPEGMRQPAPKAPLARWYRLSNGQQVDVTQWKVVLFMQGSCGYCQRFDPILKDIAQKTGLAVFPYTIDGQGDAAFPHALPAPPDVMRTFFPALPIATPTTFLVNVNTLAAWPLLQGAADEQGFLARLDRLFQSIEAVK